MASSRITLTPSTAEHLRESPPDYSRPLAEQRALREAAGEAQYREGKTEVASATDVPAQGPRPLLRVFVPLQEDATRPLIVYSHGGGWVLSSVRTHDELCRVLAAAARTTVVSVEYRLAPEHAFPAALDDVQEAYTFAAARGRGVIVAGDSAGGNLSAGLAIRLRDAPVAGLPRPAAQLLIYPALDASCATPSCQAFAAGYGFTHAQLLHFWALFLGGADRLPSAGPQASPSRAASLKGLPPALILVAQADVLRDEAVEFHERLQREGGRSELVEALGEVHGFVNRAGNPTAKATLSALGARIIQIAAEAAAAAE